jgi:hypothetical protein
MKSALERIARALCALDGHPEDATMNAKPLWQDYLPEARTVLRAIREPDDRMIEAADSQPCSIGTAQLWRAMIDAALGETNQTG